MDTKAHSWPLGVDETRRRRKDAIAVASEPMFRGEVDDRRISAARGLSSQLEPQPSGEVKPGWWQGTRPDGTTVRIEWEPAGHGPPLNEGPHVKVRVPKDPAVGPRSGWQVIEKWWL